MPMDGSGLWAAALDTLSDEDRKLVAFDGQDHLKVLSDLGKEVISAKEDSIQKRWRFHRPASGQTVILRDLFTKIAVWIDRFKEIGDIVVQYDPVHAALPWAGVRFLLQVAVSDINRFAFVVEGAEKIAHSISRYATFEQIYLKYEDRPTRAVKGLEEALIKLYAVILTYLGKANKYFGERSLKRVAKAVVTADSPFEALSRSIDEELTSLNRHAQLVDAERSNEICDRLALLSIDQREIHTHLWELLQSIDRPVCRMSRQLEILEDRSNDLEREKILRWLSSQPYKEHHRQVKKKALAGSGQWLLQHPFYLQWYMQSVSSLLWLRGKAGSGKSTLASLVIEDMAKRFEDGQSPPPVYFYCSRSSAEPERSKPDAVLASILRQLSNVQPATSLPNPIIEKYKDQGEGFASHGPDLDDSRELIVMLVENLSMTIIVVDALDECDPQMRQSLLDAFEYILKESAGLVKIFVSSRNDQDIVYTLKDYPNVNISSDQNSADIEAYVEVEAQRLVKTGQLLRNSRAKEEMTELIISQIRIGADGMFRWVSLQLDALRRLKRDEDVRARLGRLPQELGQLYLEIYNDLVSAQEKSGRSIINNALKWLLCAKEELRAPEFLLAVAANLDTSDGEVSTDNLLDLCNNFIVYDDGLQVFRFAHLSVREFLEQRPEFADVSCYSLAAECCLLKIIASLNCPNTERLMSVAHLHRLRGDLASMESFSSTNFLGYANNFWIEYCQSIPPSKRSNSTNFKRAFDFFFSREKEAGSPANVWVQWRCNRVLRGTSKALLKLQEFLITNSDSLSTSFLVAIYCGFSEIAASFLEARGLSDEMKDQGLILAAIAAQGEIFDILVEDRELWTMTEPLLLYAVEYLDKERLAWLLAKAPDTVNTPLVSNALANSWDDGKLTALMDRYPGLTITNELLAVALREASLHNFRMLVARTEKPMIVQDMLLSQYHCDKLSAIYLEKFVILLDRVGESGLTSDLMADAIIDCERCIVEAMLSRCAAGKITEELMLLAVERRETQIFDLMLQYGGKVTDAVLDKAASDGSVQTVQMLIDRSFEFKTNAKRLNLAARNSWNQEVLGVLGVLLDHTDNTTLVNEMAGLIYEVAKYGRIECLRQVLDRAEDVVISQDMIWAGMSNCRHRDPVERVRMLLDRSSKVEITEDMLILAACDKHDGIELFKFMLERNYEAEISEYVFLAAACNRSRGPEIMQLLLEQNSVAILTKDIVICAIQYSNPGQLKHILERSEVKVITVSLLKAAATNWYHGSELVRLLLARAEITSFPEEVFVEAVANSYGGIKVIHVLEETFGRIEVTESLMLKSIRRATEETVKLLLARSDPVQITKQVFLSAMNNGHVNVRTLVAEKSLHIPVTSDILQVAAKSDGVDLFRFFWNRCGAKYVPEDLINAAAQSYGYEIMAFLLYESDFVEVGLGTLVAIAACRFGWPAYRLFDLLLEQGLQTDTTKGLPETLLVNGGIELKCSPPTKLQLSSGTKVTEEIFRIAASLGNEPLLKKFADFCKLESIPSRWLDVAKLYNAATSRDNALLKALLARGVAPDVASPDGTTALTAAAWFGNEEGLQTLLSAGASPDGGPGLTSSPLCFAAGSNGQWFDSNEMVSYNMVKMLVNAGASIDFKDDEGKTPSMLAKEDGNILILKYLDQCRKERERAGQETPKPT